MNDKHLTSEEIYAYISFKLDDEKNESVIAHLSECDQCLAQADSLWEEATPQIEKTDREKLHKKLFANIHRSGLANNLFTLAIKGSLAVVLGFLSPFLLRKK